MGKSRVRLARERRPHCPKAQAESHGDEDVESSLACCTSGINISAEEPFPHKRHTYVWRDGSTRAPTWTPRQRDQRRCAMEPGGRRSLTDLERSVSKPASKRFGLKTTKGPHKTMCLSLLTRMSTCGIDIGGAPMVDSPLGLEGCSSPTYGFW